MELLPIRFLLLQAQIHPPLQLQMLLLFLLEMQAKVSLFKLRLQAVIFPQLSVVLPLTMCITMVQDVVCFSYYTDVVKYTMHVQNFK